VPVPLWLRAAPLVFVGLWSGGYAAAKAGLRYATPFAFLSIRYAIAIVVLAVVALVLRPPIPRRRRDLLHVAVVGFLIQVGYFGGSYLAFSHGISAGGLALIVSLQPILVGLVAPGLAGEHISRVRWLGLGLGLVGAALVITARSTVEAESGIPILFACEALVAMTAATLYEKRLGTGMHPVTANLVQYLVGLAVIGPVALLVENPRVEWTPALGASLGYLVLGNSLIAITLLLAMIRRGEASRVSALFFLVPPTAALIASVVIGERMPWLAWVGMAVAAAGVFAATRADRPPPPRSASA
jgi:drug/metabolite transporter (DMT)-like permease